MNIEYFNITKLIFALAIVGLLATFLFEDFMTNNREKIKKFFKK